MYVRDRDRNIEGVAATDTGEIEWNMLETINLILTISKTAQNGHWRYFSYISREKF